MTDDLVINIGEIEDVPTIKLAEDIDDIGRDDSGESSNTMGLELLMNDKRRPSGGDSRNSHNDADVHKLESELNDLAEIQPSAIKESGKSGLFSIQKEGPVETIKIGEQTADKSNSEEWGTGLNAINIDSVPSLPPEPRKSREELLKEKFAVLRKLEEIERKGGKLTKSYSMESSLEEMVGEYETLMAEKETKNSIQFQGKMLIAAVTGLEYLNGKFDPFDIKLEGWSEQIHENLNDYDEIFAELHEKYKSKAKMAPELKLLFQLGGSAIMLHMTNTMFKSSLPGMDDIMRQNPDLMQQFTQAAVGSMGQKNPGFGGFMSGLMGGGDTGRPAPPPANRPDISMARGETGINISDNYARANEPERTSRDEGKKRAEMKGPSDISDILSRMKTKTVALPPDMPKDESSTISLEELREMTTKRVPKAVTSRRQKSERNSVSLDL